MSTEYIWGTSHTGYNSYKRKAQGLASSGVSFNQNPETRTVLVSAEKAQHRVPALAVDTEKISLVCSPIVALRDKEIFSVLT